MRLILLLFLLLTALGAWEMLRHRRHRRRVPIRIHVNGSRGKSSVTRLIAAGLRQGGVRTLAKTTGSAARIIHTDGRETPVHRRGAPNIREQLGIFRQAAREGAEAIVLECMAVRPDLQRVCEHRIVKATTGVITNVRPDHLEVMGPRLADVAESLSGTVPCRGHLVTAERRFAPFLEEKARRLESGFTLADPDSVSRDDLVPFRYVEFADNLSLALAVCERAGVARETALTGMWQVAPDVGAMVPRRFEVAGKRLEFLNLFAANDPESTAFVWEHLGLRERPERAIALINIRADLMRRSKDLAPLFGRQIAAAWYVLIGEQTKVFAEILRRERVPREKIVNLGGASAEAVWRTLVELAGDDTVVVGLGNIGGAGMALLDHMDQREGAA